MRTRSRHHGRRTSSRAGGSVARVNVTPLIDVVMVLIVFFLMVGHLAAERRARLDLPEAASIDDEQRGPVDLTIDPDRGVLVANQPASASTLRDALLAEDANTRGVRLAADRALTYARIAPVLAACRDVGVSRIELAVTQGDGGGS